MSPGRKRIPYSSRPHNGKAEIFWRYIGGTLHFWKQEKKRKYLETSDKVIRKVYRKSVVRIWNNLKMMFKKAIVRT